MSRVNSRKYLEKWEADYPWLKKSSDGTESAFCTLCRVTIQPRKSSVEQHSGTFRHASREKHLNTKSQITFPLVSMKADCEADISTINHLGEIISLYGKNSPLENLRLHRTKCTQIILNVISSSIESEISESMADKPFSILIDESTDVSLTKHLCICARYYSDEQKSVIDDFLGLAAVISTTGADLFAVLETKLTSVGLSLKNCIGYSSDGASNVIGFHNSVWSRVRAASPNCILMRCTCHSLNLIVQHSFELMPSSVGFLLSEIPSFFSKSSIRREEFKVLFQTMDPSNERMGTPSLFQKYSATRWLVRGKCLYNLMVNWYELKAYFLCAKAQAPACIRYRVTTINNMFNDETLYLYVVFLTPIVQEFERLNALFQSTNVDPEKLVSELNLHYKSLQQRVLDNQGVQLPLKRVDFGAKFLSDCQKYIDTYPQTQKEIARKNIESVLTRCLQFLLRLLKELDQRLPENKEIFQGLPYLSPSKVLHQSSKMPFTHLSLRHIMKDKAQNIEDQYRKVSLVDWSSTELFENSCIPKDTTEFWTAVRHYKNTSGDAAFKELADYCLTCLVLPYRENKTRSPLLKTNQETECQTNCSAV
nr:uncharacterized protein LOC124806931 [Hydra vulgaris]